MDTFDPSTTGFGPQTANAARQRKYADYIRSLAAGVQQPQGQMVSGHYVAPSAIDYLTKPLLQAMGGYYGGQADAAEDALARQQQTHADEWRAAMPQAAEEQPLTPERVLKHAMAASGNPMLRPESDAYLKYGMSSIEAQQRREAAAEEGRLKREAAAEEGRLRREASQQALIDKGEQRAADRVAAAEREQDRNLLRMSIAASRGGGSGPRDRYSVQQGPDGAMYRVNLETGQAEPITIGAAPGGKPLTRPSVAANKTVAAADEILGKVGTALSELDRNPDAVGLKTLVPNIALQRAQPSGVSARALLAELGAEKAHELYGAAFTATERRRADQFIPAPGDTLDTVKKKLANMQTLAAAAKARAAGAAPASPAGAAPVPVSTSAEWQALPPGTPYVTKDGKTGVR